MKGNSTKKIKSKVERLPHDLYDLLSDIFSAWGIDDVITDVNIDDDITLKIFRDTELIFRDSNSSEWLVRLYDDTYVEVTEANIWRAMYMNKC